MRDYSTAFCKIFPPIGIARVGDSDDEWFIGPEAPRRLPLVESYKDKQGKVKRQAARFRVYVFFADGASEELCLKHEDVQEVSWKVTLANKKASWFEFAGTKVVSDILGGATPKKRNSEVADADRKGLTIGPVAEHVSGVEAAPRVLSGNFAVPGADPKPVKLGEILTDAEGRLLVLGGHGTSGSVIEDNPLFSYANNDGWFDDTSDGPVEATVTLKDGTRLAARSKAWVVVAPPHFSPESENVVTAYDVMVEATVRHALPWSTREHGPEQTLETSFTRDIYPFIRRLNLYQWLNDRAHRGHARGKRGSYLDPKVLAVLADPNAADKPASPHRRFFSRIRTPIIHPPFDSAEPFNVAIKPTDQEAINQATLYYMPALSGDEGDVVHGKPTRWLSVTELQYRHLTNWKDGNFVGDWNGDSATPELDDIPVLDQPAALTRAAMEMCQGGAFFPGIEFTSVIRHKSFYEEPFRPANGLEAGDITKWMALPWQADFYECGSHWWPSVRPDNVVPESDLDHILEEFDEEAEQENIASLLVVRRPWTRGVGEQVPSRSALPAWSDKQDPKNYQQACEGRLSGIATAMLEDFLPEPMERELGALFRERVQVFLDKVLQFPADEVPENKKGETLKAYRERVVGVLENWLKAELAVDAPHVGESGQDYSERLETIASGKPAWQGLFDLDWRRRDAHRGKNDFVFNWGKMGFVKRRVVKDQTILHESDRGRFDLITFREAFYYLMNIEAYPEFLPKAEELGKEYFAKGREAEKDVIGLPGYHQYRFFGYDPITFEARMEEIYEAEKQSGEAYNPVTEEGETLFTTPERVVERIRQLAPFNQLDGSWLERIAKAGPINDIQSFLFEIWSDEIGNGDPAQNHANVYVDLMHSAGIYLPPINSEAYAQHPDLWEASFSSPAYQSSAALFPQTFYPELLGMTLYLEWEAVFLPAMVKLYEYYGYPSLFYKLHVAIDNPVNGHGARAKDAVVRYLNDVLSQSGETEQQEHWRRVWDGYMAFKFVGGEEWSYRFANPPTLDERVASMFAEKRRYGQLNHGVKRFAGNLINDWFDEPGQFMAALAESDLVVKGDARRSPLFGLMGPTGPMLKVFTKADLDLLAEWVDSLPRDPVASHSAASQMIVLLEQMAARAMSHPGHDDYLLKGDVDDPSRAGAKVNVEKPISWWFAIGQPINLMKALADPANGWVIPGRANQSRLVREFLAVQRPMAKTLSRSVPELGETPARAVIVRWIDDECPMPAAKPPQGRFSARLALMQGQQPGTSNYGSDEYAAEVSRRTLESKITSRQLSRSLRMRRYGPGGGACH